MSKLSTTKMSSKGQVVIPEEIRKRLKLKEGSQFIVIGEKDVVILKSIYPPSIKEFDDIITQARMHAKKSRMKKSDISAAITKVRGKNWRLSSILMYLFHVLFTGPPFKILEAWRDGKLIIVISREILDEYYRVGKALSF